MLLGLSVATSTVVLVSPTAASADGGAACVKKSPYRLPSAQYPNPNLAEFGIPKMQAQGLTGAGVKVAVIDSGISAVGDRWKGAVLTGGKSFVGGQPIPDDYGHGTAVASMIGARPIAGAAPIGVAPGALLLPVKVDNRSQKGAPTSLLAEAIRWAATQHVQVISVSLGSDTDDPALRSAVRFAENRDVVVVAAAGDQTTTNDKGPVDKTAEQYPAGDPGVLGVAATGSTKDPRTDEVVNGASLHGPQVDVAAPGAESYFVNTEGQDCITGSYPYTSFSAPYVAGVVALLRQAYPKESAQQIIYRIEASALRPDQNKPNPVSGWGVIQPFTALTMDLDPRQPGPPFPGSSAAKQLTSTITAQQVGREGGGPLFEVSDPWQDMRSSGLWWGLGGVVLAAVAMICRPLVRRRIAESQKEPAMAGRRRAG